MKRQIRIVENGGTIVQETRSFDAVNGTTFTLRGKEEAHDYRYFPEPDIQPLTLTERDLELVKENMPPLPNDLFEKYTTDLGLSEYDAGILVETKPVALYFNELVEHTKNFKAAANWVIGEVKSYLNQTATHIEDFPLPPARIAQIISLIDEDKISNSSASQQLFPKMVENPEKTAMEIAKEENLLQESDDAWLKELVDQALAAYPEKVEAYRKGNKGLLGLFMGEVMKLSNRKANPKMANEILRKTLDQ
jgi:aspartyl-tRNA(Asn)/glutamyl-tRNA(Gln) amidotransferase subunit B